nr:hypothetical protein [Pseudomonadales bacterium]
MGMAKFLRRISTSFILIVSTLTPQQSRKSHLVSGACPLNLLLALTLLVSPTVSAQVDSATIEELRSQIAALSARLEQLEGNNQLISEVVEDTQSFARASSWTDAIEIGGDMRPRFENIGDDARSSDRNRNRVRARVSIAAQLDDHWGGELGIASGATDPISTNQTLGGGSFTKDLRMDLAYVTYSGFSDTELSAGKYRNVFFKPGGQNLIYDGDFRPEGIALAYDRDQLFFNAGTMILESDDKFNQQDKATLWGLQVGYEFSLSNDSSLTLGTSYYEAGVAGSRPFYLNDPYGNSVDDAGILLNDYEEWELFAEASFMVAGKPLSFYADYVNNLDASDFDTAWAFGVNYGSWRGFGNWEFGWGYQDLEADALLGSLTDSDFGGGGTDNEGHILSGAFGLGDSTRIGFTYSITEYGEARFGDKIDYDRLQLDIVMGF